MGGEVTGLTMEVHVNKYGLHLVEHGRDMTRFVLCRGGGLKGGELKSEKHKKKLG